MTKVTPFSGDPNEHHYPARQKNSTDREVDRYLEEVGNPPGDHIARHVEREANKILEESVRKR